ncbi:TetR family transcriptional regulator [Actinoplanes sp. NBRC 14428]|nr:TetR family transcriptional regulator [Actinoplanes sp. NBRC 14428]
MSLRPSRADARRNRDRLLGVAVEALSTGGPGVPLETIARTAGAGIGTLYRHFPTREALVDAAYRSELDRLCASAPELLRALAPEAALRAWMGRFADYTATRPGMSDALRMVIASGGPAYAPSRDLLLAALTPLLAAGAAAGTLRDDVPVLDVLTGLSGITLAAGGPDGRERAGRLLDLLLDGLRPR